VQNTFEQAVSGEKQHFVSLRDTSQQLDTAEAMSRTQPIRAYVPGKTGHAARVE